MKIREEIRGDVAVLTMSSTIMWGPAVTPFHTHIRRLAKDGITKVVVDFSRVKWLGSAMLGVMVGSLTTLRREGGDLRITDVTQKLQSILMVTRLAGIFRTLNSVEEAVASFEADRVCEPIPA